MYLYCPPLPASPLPTTGPGRMPFRQHVAIADRCRRGQKKQLPCSYQGWMNNKQERTCQARYLGEEDEIMQTTFDNFTEWPAIADGSTEGSSVRQFEMLVEMLQAQSGGPHGYRLRRIILTNFWLY